MIDAHYSCLGFKILRVPSSNRLFFTFDILKLEKKTYSLLFNERCSSSPRQQQCVTVTGWCHLVFPQGDIRLSAGICSLVLLPWHSGTRKWTWGPHNEPSSGLWVTQCLHLIRVPQLILLLCIGHSVFTPGTESEHHVWNYLSPVPSSRSLKSQWIALPCFDVSGDCLCCVFLWQRGGARGGGVTVMLVDVGRKLWLLKGAEGRLDGRVGGDGVIGDVEPEPYHPRWRLV